MFPRPEAFSKIIVETIVEINVETIPAQFFSPQHCLILHSQVATRLRLRHLLSSIGGTEIHLCESLREALWVIGSEQVDFLLTGWKCGDAEGETLLKMLMEAQKDRKFQLVLLNEAVPQVDVVRAVKLGVSGIFNAPFTATGFKALLETL